VRWKDDGQVFIDFSGGTADLGQLGFYDTFLTHGVASSELQLPMHVIVH
jgi:hypothetical protein